MREISCPNCQSREYRKVLSARDYTFPQGKEYSLVRCRYCRLVYLNPCPDAGELQKAYPEEFFLVPDDEVRKRIPGFLRFDRLSIIKRLKGPGKLLDVGCGAAAYLKKLLSEGWQVHGLDNSEVACKIAAENIGKENVFQGDLSSVSLPEGFYDVITLWHVIEHLPDPLESLGRLRRLLKEDGVLIIACPNFSSFLRRLFQGNWYPLAVPVHLLHLEYLTLERLLGRAGFRIALRKKHFIDPLTNMGSLKLSLMRAMGLGDFTTVAPGQGAGNSRQMKSGFLWRACRFLANSLCFLGSWVLSLFGNEEVMLVWAKKNGENNE